MLLSKSYHEILNKDADIACKTEVHWLNVFLQERVFLSEERENRETKD